MFPWQMFQTFYLHYSLEAFPNVPETDFNYWQEKPWKINCTSQTFYKDLPLTESMFVVAYIMNGGKLIKDLLECEGKMADTEKND